MKQYTDEDEEICIISDLILFADNNILFDRTFIDEIHTFFDENGYITEKQYLVLKKIQDQTQVKIPLDPTPYNRFYWGKIDNFLRKNGFDSRIQQVSDYLSTSPHNDKLYFKDKSFLEQLSSYLRKIAAPPAVFKMIKEYEEIIKDHEKDLKKQ
jgi:hypothetical protein